MQTVAKTQGISLQEQPVQLWLMLLAVVTLMLVRMYTW